VDGELNICLITTMTARRWSIPKGLIETGHTAAGTARKEAREEAGVHGRVVGGPVGYYGITKAGIRYTVAVNLLQVEQIDAEWEEQDVRDRQWVTADVATTLLEGRPVAAVFRRGLQQIAT
jgi:ADP-ribose pyrophosphatase YjhB (NUDIX family)